MSPADRPLAHLLLAGVVLTALVLGAFAVSTCGWTPALLMVALVVLTGISANRR